MSTNQGQGKALNEEEDQGDKKSPSEKLQDRVPIGSQVPGSEKPGSEEVKREISPNTE